MITNNSHISAMDLSSFEPEAILASLPGEHPKMAAALAVDREASQTGHLDVEELSRIANEMYAEGFAQFSSSGSASIPQQKSAADIPSTPSFSDSGNTLEQSSLPTTQVTNDVLLNGFTLPKGFGSPVSLPFSSEINTIDHHVQALRKILGELNTTPHQANNLANKPSAQHGNFYFLDSFQPTSHQQIAPTAHPAFDANLIRKDFPILKELVNGRPLIWLDNAATTQKPQAVIDRISYFYQHENSNIHRAAHEIAARATDAYEGAREKIRRFINAPSVDNIIFVRGTTEAINLVAKTWGKKYLSEGDEIVISHLEHHANIVPWQQLCLETGAKLRVAPVDDSGQILLAEYQKLLTSRAKLVSFTQVSNALGTVTPAAEMIQMAHRVGAKVLLDGAQSVSHMHIDVQQLDADFFVFSGHKVFGPTGIGILFGKSELLADMPAWQGGGNMIQDVTFDKTIYHASPAKFEAGTGNIADAVGLGAAIDYVERLGIDNIARYEHDLLVYATAALLEVPGIRLIGTAKEKASVLSFNLPGFKSEEVGAALNQDGIAVRSGHHCAQPILRRFGVETTVRPSLAFYNTYAEVDVLQTSLLRIASTRSVHI